MIELVVIMADGDYTIDVSSDDDGNYEGGYCWCPIYGR